MNKNPPSRVSKLTDALLQNAAQFSLILSLESGETVSNSLLSISHVSNSFHWTPQA